ncbi:MAG: UDP-N-acetylmuramate dehydrogenase [Clostridia bacterium]|nr:UDP-N-acetylmuramate dehydrogenase [Clostridia bacterium]
MALKDDVIRFTNATYRENVSLSEKTTIGVGGKARFYLSIDSLIDIKRTIDILNDYGIKYKLIGKGSNLLCSDNGYNGAIISYRHDRIYKDGEYIVAFSGANLNNLISFCRAEGYSGSESLFGIPATVGGAIVNNAGAFSFNVSDYLTEVYVINNGKLETINKNDCNFSYRNSIFKNNGAFIYKARFKFPKKDKKEITSTIKEIVRLRKLKFPTGKTFGSVFKNPERYSAGQLIEKCGLSGYTYGGAKISDKHCNFIINENATASDIKYLIETVKNRVYKDFNILLKEEVEYVGDF